MYNPDNIFLFTTATNTTHWDNIINSSKITANIKVIFLLLVHYILKNAPMTILLLHQSTYPDIWMALWLPRKKKYMVIFFLDEVLPDSIIQEFIQCMPNYYIPPERARREDNAKIIALQYLGMKISSTERIKAMTLLGSQHHVDIYTASDTTGLPVHNHGCAKTLTEMPLIFHYSKNQFKYNL